VKFSFCLYLTVGLQWIVLKQCLGTILWLPGCEGLLHTCICIVNIYNFQFAIWAQV
jgi:hypothetical protein